MKYALMALMFAVSSFSYASDITVEDGLSVMPKPQKIAEVTDVITMKTTAFAKSGTMTSVTGHLIGVEYPPMGDYKVNIVGNFKGERFSIMICTVADYLEEIPYADDEYIPLSTAFIVGDTVHNVIGFYTGSLAYPVENYQVIVTNGKNKQLWNALKCRLR